MIRPNSNSDIFELRVGFFTSSLFIVEIVENR